MEPHCFTHDSSECKVLGGHLAICGFSCVDLSKYSKHYGKSKTVVRDNEGKTGSTFASLLSFLEMYQLPVYVGENSQDLSVCVPRVRCVRTLRSVRSAFAIAVFGACVRALRSAVFRRLFVRSGIAFGLRSVPRVRCRTFGLRSAPDAKVRTWQT